MAAWRVRASFSNSSQPLAACCHRAVPVADERLIGILCTSREAGGSQPVRLLAPGFANQAPIYIPGYESRWKQEGRPEPLPAGKPSRRADLPMCREAQTDYEPFRHAFINRGPAAAPAPAGSRVAADVLLRETFPQHPVRDGGASPKRVNRVASQFRSARRPAVALILGGYTEMRQGRPGSNHVGSAPRPGSKALARLESVRGRPVMGMLEQGARRVTR
jgi:hypothetical protein